MNNSDIKNLSAEELKSRIQEEKEALAKMKFSHQIAGTENPMLIREKRRGIARMLTALNNNK
jgi:large subunit ribosomal protein L29